MDSTVLLHEYQEEIVLALNFHYGSLHNSREREMARLNCAELDIPLREIDLADVFSGFDSALLSGDPEQVPEGHYEDETMRATVVPFRNAIMLSIAVGYAESEKAKKVLIASHFGDHAIYPDCRSKFVNPFNQAAQAGTYANVIVSAPYSGITKRQIGLRGKGLKVDFSKTYSCYRGGEYHCGKCGTCVERKEALEGFDPTMYQPV